MWTQLGMTWSQVWLTVVSAIGVYITIVTLSRIFGQRQFATSTTYDLVFTFAMGSLVGRTLLVRVSLANAVVALCTMFALHAGVGLLHHRSNLVHDLISNKPVLLVADGQMINHAMRATGTSRVEIYETLRSAGVGTLDDVGVVILERNGSFSVLAKGQRRDPDLFAEVVDRRR